MDKQEITEKREMTTMLEWARRYVSNGFSVIPLKPKDKKPAIDSWKVFQEHKPTEDNLKIWFGNGSQNNIGIVTGSISGIAVVDFDSERAVEFAKRNRFPKTALVKTGKGYHSYYRYREGVRNFQKRDDLPDIDLRGDGGYVVAPPSIHESGKQYQWGKGKGLDDLPLAELPEIILTQKPTDKMPVKDLYHGIEEGSRNDALTRLVGSWVNDDLSFEDCLENALLWNSKNTPPLPGKEIERTIRSIFEKHHREKTEVSSERISRPIQKLRVFSIGDFLSMELPPKRKILTPWLHSQDLNMIYGYRGIGKTYVNLGIGIAVTSAGDFLGWKAADPWGVLYLDGEMPACVIQERLSRLILSSDKEVVAPFRIITPDLQEFGMPDLATLEGQAAIEPHLDGISLVIVDNISTLCRTGAENKAEDWVSVQQWALALRARGLSVLLCHHEGKSGLQRGTSKREDVLDTVIRLKRPGDYRPDEGARFEIHFEKSRGLYGDDVKPFEAKLMTGPDGKMLWTMKDLEQGLTERVADLLNEGIPQHEIPDLLGVSKGTVSKHKHKAASLGLLLGERR